MKLLPDEKKRRLVKDDAWSPELDSLTENGFVVAMKAGRHRLKLEIPDYEIRALRRVFAEVLKRRRAKVDDLADAVNGAVEP